MVIPNYSITIEWIDRPAGSHLRNPDICHAPIALPTIAGRRSLFGVDVPIRDHLPATVVSIRRNVVTAVQFPGYRVDGQRRSGEAVVSTSHSALRWSFAILLNSHLIFL